MRWFIACLLLAPLATRAADEIKIPLKVLEGDLHNRDCRVFGVPVDCAGVSTVFTWGCGGETIVSENFARKAGLRVKPDPDNAGFVDGNGNALFAGSANALLNIGGKAHDVGVWVMKDGEYNKGMTGIIGYNVARKHQWEIDPRVPQLTLRPLKSALVKKPLAVLPLKDEAQNLWLNIRIRNVPVDVCLIPQSTDFQAGPDLQKKWDLAHKGEKLEVKTYLGSVRTTLLEGKSGVMFSPQLNESNVLVILLDDNPNAKSGIGQSLLNRFVYCVDADRKEFAIMDTVSLEQVRATTQPAKK
jgi:hypothetical protein